MILSDKNQQQLYRTRLTAEQFQVFKYLFFLVA